MISFTVWPARSPDADELVAALNRRRHRGRPIDPAATAVRVRVLSGQAVSTAWGSYAEHDRFETSAATAQRLVELGIIEIVT
jgi:hypothetical protein